MREVFEHEQEARAGVVHLVLELMRRVQRIDVHDDAAGEQDAKESRRIGEDVGRHDRDPIAFF